MQQVSPPGKQIRLLIVRLNYLVLLPRSNHVVYMSHKRERAMWVNVKVCLLLEGSQGGSIWTQKHVVLLLVFVCLDSFNNFNIWRLQELAR
jgi:hypothetical protein